MRSIKCKLCDVVIVADLFNEMTDEEIERKIYVHEEDRCIERLDPK